MFDELLNLSKKIINGYQELEKLITEIRIKSATSFEVNQDAVMKNYLVYDSLIKSYSSIVDKFNSNITKLINAKVKELRELIIEENKLLNSLTEDEVDNFIKTLERIDTNNDDCIARLRERLIVRGYILEGYSFRGDKILKNSILYNMNFYDKDIMSCIMKIEIFKRLKYRIKLLDNDNNFWFIRNLYRFYNKYLLSMIKDNTLLELIVFYYDFDIDNIDCFDEFNVDDILDNNEGDNTFDDIDDEEPNYEFEIEETNDDYYDSLYEEASEVIDIIVSIDPNTKDIEEYFELLYYFTCLEVIIESMNIDELAMTKDHILESNLDDSNNLYRDARDENKNPNMKLVRRLVERKLDEEKN